MRYIPIFILLGSLFGSNIPMASAVSDVKTHAKPHRVHHRHRAESHKTK